MRSSRLLRGTGGSDEKNVVLSEERKTERDSPVRLLGPGKDCVLMLTQIVVRFMNRENGYLHASISRRKRRMLTGRCGVGGFRVCVQALRYWHSRCLPYSHL